MAMVNPLIHAEGIEISEFPELAQTYGVQAVPLTVVNDRFAVPGMIPEDQFVEIVVKAAEDSDAAPSVAGGPTNAIEAPPSPRVERGKERPAGCGYSTPRRDARRRSLGPPSTAINYTNDIADNSDRLRTIESLCMGSRYLELFILWQ
jgi:hypothetical protein